MSQMGLGGFLEVFGGMLLLVGLLSAAGAGPWSVDAWLKSRKERRPRVLRPQRRPVEVGHGHGGKLPA